MDVVDWTNGGDKYDTEEKPCSELVNTTIEVSYNAVVGFTKPLLEDENPLMFVLNAWEDGTDLTTGAQDADYKGWDDLPFRTASVEYVPPLHQYIYIKKASFSSRTSSNLPKLGFPPRPLPSLEPNHHPPPLLRPRLLLPKRHIQRPHLNPHHPPKIQPLNLLLPAPLKIRRRHPRPRRHG